VSERQNIYVRAYARPLKQKSKKSPWYPNPPKWADHALIFDCETRITADQTLTFGFWRFCELRDGRFVALEEGILLDDSRGLSDKEIAAISDFAKRNKADTADDGFDRIRVYSRFKFLREVLGLAIQAKAFIVCFNAGFDLSRLAVDWGTARNGGWSLIFFQWRNPKTGQLEPLKYFPRIVIKALSSKTSIIHSTRPPMREPRIEGEKVPHWPAARFLDPRTLLWALRNRSYSLESACKEFKTEHQKIDHGPTGKVSREEIEYARGDVACTVDLLNTVKQEFDLHPISAGPDQMFSPASVAKSYLEELNILHPSEKV
jgi:hypothetical protein